jgi:hypothetical protein
MTPILTDGRPRSTSTFDDFESFPNSSSAFFQSVIPSDLWICRHVLSCTNDQDLLRSSGFKSFKHSSTESPHSLIPLESRISLHVSLPSNNDYDEVWALELQQFRSLLTWNIPECNSSRLPDLPPPIPLYDGRPRSTSGLRRVRSPVHLKILKLVNLPRSNDYWSSMLRSNGWNLLLLCALLMSGRRSNIPYLSLQLIQQPLSLLLLIFCFLPNEKNL